jgi:hypothetical protein
MPLFARSPREAHYDARTNLPSERRWVARTRQGPARGIREQGDNDLNISALTMLDEDFRDPAMASALR